jgi:hypothetical protein
MDSVPVEAKELTQSEEDLIGQMQTIIQLFLDLLQVTGGDLAPEKCIWFMICHRWNYGEALLLTVQDSHRGIKIASWSTGNVSGVKRKAPKEVHRTLGFKISGDGKCIAQKKAITEKSHFGSRRNKEQHNVVRRKWHSIQFLLRAKPEIWNTGELEH